MSLLRFEDTRRRVAADGSRRTQPYSEIPAEDVEFDVLNSSNAEFADYFLSAWGHPRMLGRPGIAALITKQCTVSAQEAASPGIVPAGINRLHTLLYVEQPSPVQEDTLGELFDRAMQRAANEDQISALDSVRVMHLWSLSEPEALVRPERVGRIIDAIMTNSPSPQLGKAAVGVRHLHIVE